MPWTDPTFHARVDQKRTREAGLSAGNKTVCVRALARSTLSGVFSFRSFLVLGGAKKKNVQEDMEGQRLRRLDFVSFQVTYSRGCVELSSLSGSLRLAPRY